MRTHQKKDAMKMSDLKRELRRAIRKHGDLELCRPKTGRQNGRTATMVPAHALLLKYTCEDGKERITVRLIY